jgi:hypothetical protein
MKGTIKKMKQTSSYNIQPPARFIANPSSKGVSIQGVGSLNTPIAGGLALHQGNLPFISLNKIHITFSPFLLAFIGIFGFASVFLIERLPDALIPPLLLIILLFAQLAGNLIAGLLLKIKPDSLILSLSGVVDPGLINEHRKKIISLPNDDSLPEDEALASMTASMIRDLKFSQLRAIGSSLGAIAFLFALSVSPISTVLMQQLLYLDNAALLAHVFWIYGCFIVIAPFLPPHKMNSGFKQQLISAVIPVFILGLAITLTKEQLFFEPGAPEVAFFILALSLRAFWWNRISGVSNIAERISVEEAMIPLNNLVLLTHGETVATAQNKALKSPQPLFPIIMSNELISYVSRNTLLRTAFDQEEQGFIGDLATPATTFLNCDTSLDVAFGPECPLPAFIVDNAGQVAGVITAEQVRDALLLALTGNPRLNSSKSRTLTPLDNDHSNSKKTDDKSETDS